ncbi:MAG: 7-carboxy-7-deazaguanine synthase QueE [Bacillota bacterium]
MFAHLQEIFSSVQGEGRYVGCRQIFLRFAGCNLKCAYCDTPVDPSPSCRCELTPGKKDFVFIPNPLTPVQTAAMVAKLNPQIHHSLSLTGGEPLLHAEFLLELIPLLPRCRQGVYLETNGSLPLELSRVIHLVDLVAMDIKLPSVAAVPPLWAKHREFLAVAREKQVFVKIVVDEKISLQELDMALQLIKEAGSPPLIIQPVTPAKNDQPAVASEHLLLLQERALQFLPEVRVVPQVHKVLGLL